MRAKSSLRWRNRATARSRMRERSAGGVDDQEGKAFWAEVMAASIEEGEEVWSVQMGWAVEGSIVWKVDEPGEGCGRPEWKVWRSDWRGMVMMGVVMEVARLAEPKGWWFLCASRPKS